MKLVEEQLPREQVRPVESFAKYKNFSSLANEIVQAMAKRVQSPKPWRGPLPPPRVSPPKTIGDIVVKYKRPGAKFTPEPLLFKQAMPATTSGGNALRNQPNTRQPSVGENKHPWPRLGLASPTRQTSLEERSSPELQTKFQSEACFADWKIQNLKSHRPKLSAQTKPNTEILVTNGATSAWFRMHHGLPNLLANLGRPPWAQRNPKQTSQSLRTAHRAVGKSSGG